MRFSSVIEKDNTKEEDKRTGEYVGSIMRFSFACISKEVKKRNSQGTNFIPLKRIYLIAPVHLVVGLLVL